MLNTEKENYRALVFLLAQKFSECVDYFNGHHCYAYEAFSKDPYTDTKIIEFLGTLPLDHIYKEIRRTIFLDAFTRYRYGAWG